MQVEKSIIADIIKERIDNFELSDRVTPFYRGDAVGEPALYDRADFSRDDCERGITVAVGRFQEETEYFSIARAVAKECNVKIIDTTEYEMINKKMLLSSAMAAASAVGRTAIRPFRLDNYKRSFLSDTRGSKEVQAEKQRLAQEKRDKKQKNRLRNIALAEQGKDYV